MDEAQASATQHGVQTQPRSGPVPTAHIQHAQGVIQDIGNESITPRAEHIRYNTDEEMIWQASPSLRLAIAPAIRWMLVVLVCLWGIGSVKKQIVVELQQQKEKAAAKPQAVVMNPPATPKGSKKHRLPQVVAPPVALDMAVVEQAANKAISTANYFMWFVVVVATLRVLWIFLKLKFTKYAATSQRLIVESGVFVSRNIPFELHRLGNAVILKPFFQRFMGLSDLAFPANRIVLKGLNNAEYVRDILRTGGQLEAQRFDKVRWR